MLKLVYRFLVVLLLVLPFIVQIADYEGGSRMLACAAEDAVVGEDDDDEGTVETEEAPAAADSQLTSDGSGDDDEDKPLKPSPDADTHFMFVKPPGSTDLPAGVVADFLVGFTNKGVKEFVVDTIDASFRYPMDFNFHIQNFSLVHYNRMVKPKQQVTLAYTFVPSETFAARPFGLTVNLNYHDSDGNQYLEAVFNETVNIVELDEGMDGETIFLYVFLAACIVLLIIGGQQFLASYGRKRPTKSKPVEMGTSNPNDVDFDWLPKETLNEIRKTTPRQSPRQRRTKRNTGSDE